MNTSKIIYIYLYIHENIYIHIHILIKFLIIISIRSSPPKKYSPSKSASEVCMMCLYLIFYVYIYIYLYICVYMCIYLYIYICIYNMYIYTHICLLYIVFRRRRRRERKLIKCSWSKNRYVRLCLCTTVRRRPQKVTFMNIKSQLLLFDSVIQILFLWQASFFLLISILLCSTGWIYMLTWDIYGVDFVNHRLVNSTQYFLDYKDVKWWKRRSKLIITVINL
jgi:hypothetical protein